MEMEIHLNEKEVLNIVSKYLESKGHKVKDSKMEIGTQWQGYGANESQYPVFKKITVKVESSDL